MSFTFTTNRIRGLAFDLVNKIRQDLQSQDKTATRRLISSVRADVVAQPSLISLIGKAEKHWIFVDKGRRAGKMPPKAPILRWLRARGLDIKFQFVIRRKIGREGVKGTNIFTNATNEFTRKFFQRTNQALQQDIINQTRESLTIK